MNHLSWEAALLFLKCLEKINYFCIIALICFLKYSKNSWERIWRLHAESKRSLGSEKCSAGENPDGFIE